MDEINKTSKVGHYLLLLILATGFYQVFQMGRVVLLKFNLQDSLVAYMICWVLLIWLLVIVADWLGYKNVIPL